MKATRVRPTIPAGLGVGPSWSNADRVYDIWVQVDGVTGGGSVTIVGSMDDLKFHPISQAIVKDGIYPIPAAIMSLAVRVDAQANGVAPTVIVTARFNN